MNIDERLEALTQSVELLAQMHRDNEAKYEQRFERLESLIERIVTVQESLGAIATNHERRLNDLEG
jgi:septation ring formation regulator EzrA